MTDLPRIGAPSRREVLARFGVGALGILIAALPVDVVEAGRHSDDPNKGSGRGERQRDRKENGGGRSGKHKKNQNH